MKIRNGFVSNSSSSSFVAVGIEKHSNKKIFEDILNAIGAPLGEYECDDFYPGEKYASAKLDDGAAYGTMETTNGSNLCLYGGYEFYFVGLDAFPLFEKDFKLSEIKKRFKQIVREKYGVKVNLSQIKLVSDTTSSE